MGGIRTGKDALEFLAAGASAVSVGTAIFNDPSAPARVHRELRELLAAKGISDIADVVGIAHTPLPSKGDALHAAPAISAQSSSSTQGEQIVIRSERIVDTQSAVLIETIDDIALEFDRIKSQPISPESGAETTTEVE
jgi:hypothetical protein